MTLAARNHRVMAFTGTLLCLMVAGALLYDQAVTVGRLRTEALPLAQDVTEMDGRLTLLTRQAEEEAALVPGGIGATEAAQVALLPRGTPEARAVMVLEALETALRRAGDVRSLSVVSRDDVPAPSSLPPGVQSRRLALTAVVSGEGWLTLSRVLRLSGRLRVADVLRPADIDRLLEASERAGSAAGAVLAEVLQMNLVTYAQDPAGTADRLLTAFGSDASGAVSAAMASAGLRDAHALLSSPVGQALRDGEYWPLPLMTLLTLRREDLGDGQWFRVDVTLRVFGRE